MSGERLFLSINHPPTNLHCFTDWGCRYTEERRAFTSCCCVTPLGVYAGCCCFFLPLWKWLGQCKCWPNAATCWSPSLVTTSYRVPLCVWNNLTLCFSVQNHVDLDPGFVRKLACLTCVSPNGWLRQIRLILKPGAKWCLLNGGQQHVTLERAVVRRIQGLQKHGLNLSLVDLIRVEILNTSLCQRLALCLIQREWLEIERNYWHWSSFARAIEACM